MGCSSFIFASPVHFYCFLSLQSSVGCMMGLVHSLLHRKDNTVCNKHHVFWKATSSKFKQTLYSFGSLRPYLSGTLVMWGLFCQRLKAKSKARFEQNKTTHTTNTNFTDVSQKLLFFSKTKKIE